MYPPIPSTKATNLSDEPVVGVSTYNVLPYSMAPYFNKVQCFCFEEQRLNPRETIDMPVFFYIDPECVDDPGAYYQREVVLSYTFFESKQGALYDRWNIARASEPATAPAPEPAAASAAPSA